MNNIISNSGLPSLAHTSKAQQPGSSTTPAVETTGSSASGAAGPGDRVRLTDSARALQDASRSGENSPVNAQKVAQIRQALDNGSYQINPARIADGLIRLDQQLGAAFQGHGQS